MQLFGLINTLLSQDQECAKRHLSITPYSITPLSPSAGLMGWVTHSDTLHMLIKSYRESRKILVDIEHRLMQQVRCSLTLRCRSCTRWQTRATTSCLCFTRWRCSSTRLTIRPARISTASFGCAVETPRLGWNAESRTLAVWVSTPWLDTFLVWEIDILRICCWIKSRARSSISTS